MIKKRFKCNFCSETVQSLKKYEKHIRRIHNHESEANRIKAIKEYLKESPEELSSMIKQKSMIKNPKKNSQDSKSVYPIYTPMGNKN